MNLTPHPTTVAAAHAALESVSTGHPPAQGVARLAADLEGTASVQPDAEGFVWFAYMIHQEDRQLRRWDGTRMAVVERDGTVSDTSDLTPDDFDPVARDWDFGPATRAECEAWLGWAKPATDPTIDADQDAQARRTGNATARADAGRPVTLPTCAACGQPRPTHAAKPAPCGEVVAAMQESHRNGVSLGRIRAASEIGAAFGLALITGMRECMTLAANGDEKGADAAALRLASTFSDAVRDAANAKVGGATHV